MASGSTYNSLVPVLTDNINFSVLHDMQVVKTHAVAARTADNARSELMKPFLVDHSAMRVRSVASTVIPSDAAWPTPSVLKKVVKKRRMTGC